MRSLLPLLLLAASACREPTEITVELSTDACGDEIAVDVSNSVDGAIDAPALTTRACSGTVVLIPGAGDTALLRVTQGRGKPASACAAPTPGDTSCVVARRRLAYVPHTPLRLPIALTSDCAGVVCDEASTCLQGHCVSASVTPECTDLRGCADASVEAGSGDAATDAGVADADAGPGNVVVGPLSGPLYAITNGIGSVYFSGQGYLGQAPTSASPRPPSRLRTRTTLCGSRTARSTPATLRRPRSTPTQRASCPTRRATSRVLR